jgi:hypothetical protein
MSKSLRFCCICLSPDRWIQGRIIFATIFFFSRDAEEIKFCVIFSEQIQDRYMNLNLRLWISELKMRIYDFVNVWNHIYSIYMISYIHKIIYIRCSLVNSINSTVNRIFWHIFIYFRNIWKCVK